ncbi:MAG: deoxyribodipyrimidine photo-lyase [Filomicrobium sp.]
MTSLVWFRQDLRIEDNPALAHAAERGKVVGLYVLDETPEPEGRPIGAASRWWLHHSLTQLERSLGRLVLLRGNPLELVPKVAERVGADAVCWNRCYEPYAVKRDTALKAKLSDSGFEVASFNGSLLFEPWEVETQGGLPYKVYSAFWRACLKLSIAAPVSMPTVTLESPDGIGDAIEDWGLLPQRPNWAMGFEAEWQPGEAGARQRLDWFLEHGLKGYGELRNRPDLENVSRLSPHLHFGEISPRQIWSQVMHHVEAQSGVRKDAEKFLSEIGWREFAYHLLYHFPKLASQNWRPEFDEFPWAKTTEGLKDWQRGRTGFPIVDAGLRELWATGYMHNRVRMIVASFLIKDLRIHWREGEAWFWDTLVDADLANNAASWQWVAGSGADAAPYFRIFNPITQGRKFDPNGHYVRRWCPELADLSDKYLHAPFEAPSEELERAGVVLGESYPSPMVDHAEARTAAMAGYERMKSTAA